MRETSWPLLIKLNKEQLIMLFNSKAKNSKDTFQTEENSGILILKSTLVILVSRSTKNN